eukprot:m.19261 g.19261  ORF g.19261 m.19261 type:complete len:622 (+) comp8004_c0_seq1:234-2099(+)
MAHTQVLPFITALVLALGCCVDGLCTWTIYHTSSICSGCELGLSFTTVLNSNQARVLINGNLSVIHHFTSECTDHEIVLGFSLTDAAAVSITGAEFPATVRLKLRKATQLNAVVQDTNSTVSFKGVRAVSIPIALEVSNASSHAMVSFDELEACHDLSVKSESSEAAISMPLLTHVAGDVKVLLEQNATNTIHLPFLSSVDGSMTVKGASDVEASIMVNTGTAAKTPAHSLLAKRGVEVYCNSCEAQGSVELRLGCTHYIGQNTNNPAINITGSSYFHPTVAVNIGELTASSLSTDESASTSVPCGPLVVDGDVAVQGRFFDIELFHTISITGDIGITTDTVTLFPDTDMATVYIHDTPQNPQLPEIAYNLGQLALRGSVTINLQSKDDRVSIKRLSFTKEMFSISSPSDNQVVIHDITQSAGEITWDSADCNSNGIWNVADESCACFDGYKGLSCNKPQLDAVCVQAATAVSAFNSMLLSTAFSQSVDGHPDDIGLRSEDITVQAVNGTWTVSSGLADIEEMASFFFSSNNIVVSTLCLVSQTPSTLLTEPPFLPWLAYPTQYHVLPDVVSPSTCVRVNKRPRNNVHIIPCTLHGLRAFHCFVLMYCSSIYSTHLHAPSG